MLEERELKRIPVVLSGAWDSAGGSGLDRWIGRASATEAIVALALRSDSSGWAYSRSQRVSTNSLDLGILVLPYDSENRHVQLVLQVGSGDGAIRTEATLSTPYRSGASIQVVEGANATGEPTWFAEVFSEPGVRLGAIFVAEEDTRRLRTGLWRLRTSVVAGDQELTRALNHGRTGSFTMAAGGASLD